MDVRIVAASCKDLKQKIREDSFRSDLYFRINVVNVNMPPLRERRGDIPLLASYFITKYSKSSDDTKRYLQPEILETLQAYDWPGNVRELSNWAERILAVGSVQSEAKKAAVSASMSGSENPIHIAEPHPENAKIGPGRSSCA